MKKANMSAMMIDSKTIDTFYELAASQPDSVWINEVLDKFLPLSLLECSSIQSLSLTQSIETMHAILSAKHLSWENYVSSVGQYNNSVTCGLVWTKNYYAYRCRTCAISQCMSLCEDCFKAGNHEGHDYNLFRSSSGGACDCGDPDVMKPLGFCCKHGEHNAAALPSAPSELVATARVVLPRLLLLLVMHLRRNHAVAEDCMASAEWLFALLKQITDLGASMLNIVCSALTDERLYSETLAPSAGRRRIYAGKDNDAAFASLAEQYQTAVSQLPSVLPNDGSAQLGGVSILERLCHHSLLDELTFWMVYTRFPQPLIGLLLAMLPVRAYKTPFAATFTKHYLRTVAMLCNSDKPPVTSGASTYQANLSYRVVHISVQLLSAAGICELMCERHALLERALIGLDYVLAASSSGTSAAFRPASLDESLVAANVEHPIMMEQRYWPVVSDLVNILVHRPVAMRLLSSEGLLAHYTAMLGRLHLANINTRAMDAALQFDNSRAYYSAFAADSEIAACTLWTLWNWARSDPGLVLAVLRHAANVVHSGRLNCDYDSSRLSFHLPVHRLISAFLCALPDAAVASGDSWDIARILGAPVNDFLLPPLRTLIGYCEINSDLWLRNGLQIKGQAMTYVHSTFCCSLVDLDLHLVQTCVALMPDRAHTVRCLFKLLLLEELLRLDSAAGDNPLIGPDNADRAAAMAEWGLQLVAWLVCLFPANCLARDPPSQLVRELIVAVSVEDRTHSQLVESLPERDSAHHEPGRQSAALQPALARVAELSSSSASSTTAPASMSTTAPMPSAESAASTSGLEVLAAPVYRLRPEVWLRGYDPLMTSLRCHQRRQHQAGLDRYSRFLANFGDAAATAAVGVDEDERRRRQRRDYQAWPPYRLPRCWMGNKGDDEGEGEGECNGEPELPAYLVGVTDILHTSAMHSRLFALLYKFVYNQQAVRSGTLSLAVFLLELALVIPRRDSSTEVYTADHESDCQFPSHDLRVNLCYEVILPQQQPVSLLSLLLAVHRLLSDGANPTLAQLRHCRVTGRRRVGEGRDFVCRVIALACPPGTANHDKLLAMLDPQLGDSGTTVGEVAQAASAGDRRSAVEERKRKLMERMVAQQRAFAASLPASTIQEAEPNPGGDAVDGSSAAAMDTVAVDQEESAECCICQKSSTDTVAASPFALLALAQPSAILAHRTCQLAAAAASSRRLSTMLEASHWFDALTELRWGIVLTSCGHCVHTDCVQPYISGLEHQASRLYPCPLCRQTFNLVLPLCPGVAWEGPPNPQTPLLRNAAKASDLLAMPVQTASGKLLSLAQLWSPAPPPMEDHERWSFWAGILLTNLRLELCLLDRRDSRLHARYLARCCTGRLLRFLMRKAGYELCRRESSTFLTAFLDHFMTGAAATPGANAAAADDEAEEFDAPFQPLLLQDAGKMLVLLVLTAVCKKQQWFAAMAAAYNLAYVQALLAELIAATEQERQLWSQPSSSNSPLPEHLQLVLKRADLLLQQTASSRQPQLADPPPPPRSAAQLVSRIESRLAPLLRLAALLLGHMTGPPTPTQPPPPLPSTFSELSHRLGLCQQHHLQQQQQPQPDDSAGAPMVPPACSGCSPARLFTPLDAAGLDRLAAAWLAAVSPPHRRPVACLIDRLALPSELRPPRLIDLPPTYDMVFSENRNRSCRRCKQRPTHPAICLVCAEFLCFNSPCCQARHGEDTVGECHRHSVLCGAGLCPLLAVDSSFVWLFTHGQALRWGSLYLDEFGEEDEELRRGKPLYLNRQRFEALESQWLLHNYYSSAPRPVWASNSL